MVCISRARKICLLCKFYGNVEILIGININCISCNKIRILNCSKLYICGYFGSVVISINYAILKNEFYLFVSLSCVLFQYVELINSVLLDSR